VQHADKFGKYCKGTYCRGDKAEDLEVRLSEHFVNSVTAEEVWLKLRFSKPLYGLLRYLKDPKLMAILWSNIALLA
jgi:hypothetical protein